MKTESFKLQLIISSVKNTTALNSVSYEYTYFTKNNVHIVLVKGWTFFWVCDWD